MSVKLLPDKWTEVLPEGDARTIHVSTAGSDSNGGTSPSTPLRTPSKGIAALRDGKGDQCLFRGGDTFPEPIGRVIKSGESKDKPILVGSYGTGRPIFPGGVFNYGGGAPPSMAHVFYQSLHFKGNGAGRGFEILRPISDLTIEDVCIEGFGTNVVLQGADGPLGPDVRMRRCQIIDAWSSGSEHSQGLYTDKLTGFSAFECLFDHNGYGGPTVDTGDDIFRHGIYFQNGPASAASVLDGCVISNNSSHGAQLRAGGTVKACLFTGNAIALSVGGGNTPHPAGIPAVVQGTVILNGRDIDAAQKRGWGMVFSNINGARVTGNLIAHNKGGMPSGISLEGDVPGFGIHGFTLKDNVIHDWGAGLNKQGAIHDYFESGNSFEQPASKYVDPTKNVPMGYIAALRAMHRGNWDTRLMPYAVNRGILAGFVAK